MTVKPVSDRMIAETSSKGNQEKWTEGGRWYKLDQFGYEALAEVLTSELLERSNIESGTPFRFTRYRMERIAAHGRERTGCSSENFLGAGESIVTLSRLYRLQGSPLPELLAKLPSGRKRLAFLAERTAELTGLADFPRYLTLLLEIDALVLNDDRHLNNIAVIDRGGSFGYCPIFDQGAGLLSNILYAPMDIIPASLIRQARARPLNMTFGRQLGTARGLYGSVLRMPKLTAHELSAMIEPLLEYYPARDRALIADRACQVVLTRQKYIM